MKSKLVRSVRFSEIDDNGELLFGKIIDFLQDCSSFESEELGNGVDYQMKNHRAWVLSSWYIRVNQKPRYNDEVEVSTWACGFNKVSGFRNYAIRYPDSDENIVEALANWVMFDMDTQSLTRLVPEDIENYEVSSPLNLPKVPRRIKPGEDYVEQESFRVMKCHLDINRHMNNAWYVKLAEEYIDLKDKITVIRVDYKKSAKHGDIIIPFVCKEDLRYVIELRSENGDVFATVEFVIDAE